jgi:UDP-N-acetylmuramate dehydrogenase
MILMLFCSGMQIQSNFSLKPYNTFGINVRARYFSTFSDIEQLKELSSHNPMTIGTPPARFILGGGSNILFTKDFDGHVLKNDIRGIAKINEDDEYVYVRVGAGENWHQFVLFCIKNNWQGIENLSLIPGNVGASPMQNIGAYGVEIRELFLELNAFHVHEKSIHKFNLRDCQFGYRESVFKKNHKDQFVILDVTYRLNKTPRFNTSYGAVEKELQRMKVHDLSAAAISQAIINIRTSKLPDPAAIGNAGSFFKNPSVSKEKFAALKTEFENIIGFENSEGSIKLAAGWLIEQCGWKGFRKGDAGCYDKQALVLVNYGGATGAEIYNLSEEIRQSVIDKFGVALEREVNII